MEKQTFFGETEFLGFPVQHEMFGSSFLIDGGVSGGF